MSDLSVDVVIEIVRSLAGDRAVSTDITSETPLLSSGLVDSLAVAELADVLGERFGIHVNALDLGYDNADTPTLLVEFIEESR